MEDVDKRTEYVLNETGRIWQGAGRGHYGKPWNFGQVGICTWAVNCY